MSASAPAIAQAPEAKKVLRHFPRKVTSHLAAFAHTPRLSSACTPYLAAAVMAEAQLLAMEADDFAAARVGKTDKHHSITLKDAQAAMERHNLPPGPAYMTKATKKSVGVRHK